MEKQLEDIKAIREMMEKSSKFLSLSGLSGVLAGVTATLGAAFAWFYLLRNPEATNFNRSQELIILLADAFIVLTLSISFALYFSWEKAKKQNIKLINKTTLKTIYNLGIPLLAGGLFSIICLLRGNVEIVASTTLIFYGLGLINASKYTFEEIHYLGITEIVLGIGAAIFLSHGIIFWTIGFGICHIVYGLILYKKYDLK
jgi:hypothetical protein